MFWLAYLSTVIVGGTFAVILQGSKEGAPRVAVSLRTGASERAKSPRCH